MADHIPRPAKGGPYIRRIDQLPLVMSKFPLYVLLLAAIFHSRTAQAYTTVYGSETYYSAQPYNLDLYYFVASDVPLDPHYKARYSAMTLWLQEYYRQWMIANGYGDRSFGVWTEESHPDSVRIVLIQGQHPLDHYRSTDQNPNGSDHLLDEVEAFANANPTLVTSAHRAVAIAAPSFSAMHDLPYWGLGRGCYFSEYPELDMQYMGQNTPLGDLFVTYFGGFAHELGHAINLPHSHQTATENNDPAKGMNLMAAGNYTLTASPTFINRAGAAILSNCQLFSTVENDQFYNGHHSGIVALHSQVQNGNLIVSGRFVSDRVVTDINFYQDPGAEPTQGYVRVAFSTPPLGPDLDSFWVSMPAAEVLQGNGTWPQTGPYNLEIELVLANGETSEDIFAFTYANGTPVTDFDFNDTDCDVLPDGWTLADIGAEPATPGSACFSAADNSLVMRSWSGGFGGNSDEVTYLYMPLTGTSIDTAEVRVTEVSAEWNYLGGLMLRRSLDDNSGFTSLSALDTRGVFSMWRSQTGNGTNYNVVTALPLPMWLRIVRNGNNVRSFYSTNGTNWTQYNTQTFTLGNTYYLGLVVSGGGCRARFDNLRVNNGTLVGVGEAVEAERAFSAYPVPANDVLHFPAAAMGAALRITDVDGRTVFHEARQTQRSIDIADLAPGLYLLHWQQSTGSFTQKVVVQH